MHGSEGDVRDNGDWKNKVFENLRLTDEDCDESHTDCCDNAFKYLDDLDKRMNKRIYICPGRDGSSDDKIALDLKFDLMSTKVSIPKLWKQQGYVKTTFILMSDTQSARTACKLWTLVEEQVDLATITEIGVVYEKLGELGINEKIRR